MKAFEQVKSGYKQNSVNTLTTAELRSMGNIACGISATDIASIDETVFWYDTACPSANWNVDLLPVEGKDVASGKNNVYLFQRRYVVKKSYTKWKVKLDSQVTDLRIQSADWINIVSWIHWHTAAPVLAQYWTNYVYWHWGSSVPVNPGNNIRSPWKC